MIYESAVLILQDIVREQCGICAHTDEQILHIVISTAVQKKACNLAHVTVFRLFERSALDPQIERAHRLTAPDLHIELTRRITLHRPTGGASEIPAEDESHLHLRVLFRLRDLGGISLFSYILFQKLDIFISPYPNCRTSDSSNVYSLSAVQRLRL